MKRILLLATLVVSFSASAQSYTCQDLYLNMEEIVKCEMEKKVNKIDNAYLDHIDLSSPMAVIRATDSRLMANLFVDYYSQNIPSQVNMVLKYGDSTVKIECCGSNYFNKGIYVIDNCRYSKDTPLSFDGVSVVYNDVAYAEYISERGNARSLNRQAFADR